MAESSCAKLFSRAPVAILHVPDDSAGPLSLARYIGVMRLAAPCAAPLARLRYGHPERAKGLSRKPRGWPIGSSSAATAGASAWPGAWPRTARPPMRSSARAAGNRAAAWSAATPAASLPDRRCGICNRQCLSQRVRGDQLFSVFPCKSSIDAHGPIHGPRLDRVYLLPWTSIGRRRVARIRRLLPATFIAPPAAVRPITVRPSVNSPVMLTLHHRPILLLSRYPIGPYPQSTEKMSVAAC